jgi:hypothetical protein
LFVKVVAYIDESGTHNKTGARKGATEIVIAGLVAWRDGWEKFCGERQAVLNRYSAPYFHCKEWAGASMAANGRTKASRKNPYFGWPVERLEEFRYELAAIVGSGNKVVVGGYVNTAQFHQAKLRKDIDPGVIPCGGDPYKHCIAQLFEQLPRDILSEWPLWEEPVTIFYDWTEPAAQHAIVSAHDACRKKDRRIGEPVFADKKKPAHLPLQAADMVAYRFRQLAERDNRGKCPIGPTQFDALLLASLARHFPPFK